jgi:hypothetical protein
MYLPPVADKKAQGLWYTLTGTGATLEASTCDGTDFDTIISIFKGPCDSMTNTVGMCVVSDDDTCLPYSNVTWITKPAQVYYILVRGFANSDTGDFALKLVTLSPPTSSKKCDGFFAIIINLIVKIITLGLVKLCR